MRNAKQLWERRAGREGSGEGGTSRSCCCQVEAAVAAAAEFNVARGGFEDAGLKLVPWRARKFMFPRLAAVNTCCFDRSCRRAVVCFARLC